MTLMEGYLSKSPPKSTVDLFQFKRWKRRYFQLIQYDNLATLEYKKTPNSKDLKGIINLQDTKYFVVNFPFLRHRRNLFALKIDDSKRSRIFYFNASSNDDFRKWKDSLLKVLNFQQKTIPRDIAEELIVAGFLTKSPSTKEIKEISDMFTQSLMYYCIEESLMDPPPVERKCKGYYEIKNPCQSLNSDYLSPLPIRCTSMLSSSSSSNSDDEVTSLDETNNNESYPVYLNLTPNQSHNKSKPVKPPTKLPIIELTNPHNSPSLTYIDASQLDLKNRNSESVREKDGHTKEASDGIVYTTIDPVQTAALSKLRKKLDYNSQN